MSSLLFRDIAFHEDYPSRPFIHKLIKVNSKMYIVWADGIIWNLSDSKYCKPYKDNDNYSIVSIGNRTCKVHRLVLMCFDRGPKYGEEVRHLDGDPQNNDISNLVWGSKCENWQDRREHGRAYKLTIMDVEHIRISDLSSVELSRIYNVSQANISNIRRKIIWRSVK